MNHPPTRTPASATHDAIPWYQQFRRSQIVQFLEAVQDLIAISLCLGLFGVMVLQLKRTFTTLISTSAFHEVTADILFILILVELFRLLIIYLQEQRVSIGVAVEIAIVSVLREVIVRGVLETDWQQILAVCLFLMTMALLMVVRVWLPPTFAGVDPEGQVSARMRQSHEQPAHQSPGHPRLEQEDLSARAIEERVIDERVIPARK
ncbi:phosphate-starvation-inducible PsiE family protein [Synechococcus sp. CCY 9618]|uniref:phosphate-starvation-inducible PsiE family protein n=1 Tax=Synechococcus sp. CCY 9618 TaxID=2815602 RepID=UPI001C232F70|nr:phosphate-starvation-inducible PsiE family protein [Synechococcus sp. CCY 9618]